MARVDNANFSNLDPEVKRTFESKVIAPRNPTLIKSNQGDDERITPSQYISSMMLNTEERLIATRHMKLPTIIELLDMSQTTYQIESHVDIDEAIFQPFPSELIFQNFKPFQPYRIPLLLRNNDKVPRLIKVTHDTSPYFCVESPDDVSKKVAPGMSSTFYVQFTPDAIKDYAHELICTSERERILVPIKCIGGRGLLDFPDLIVIDDCPVKMSKEKTLLIRNIGSVDAKFSLYSTNDAFEAIPSSGELKSQQAMQIS